MDSSERPPISFPHIIYGTAIRNGVPPPPISTAIATGYRAFDIASHSAHDEEEFGRQLQEILLHPPPITTSTPKIERSSIFIQAKYSPPIFFNNTPNKKTPPYLPTDPIPLQVLKSFANTLSILKTSYIDVYFLHRPFRDPAQTYAAWEVMEEIHRRGGCKYLGISQVDLSTLEDLWDKAEIKPRFVQNQFTSSPASRSAKPGKGCNRGYDQDVRRFCKERGIVYQAFGILGDQNVIGGGDLGQHTGEEDKIMTGGSLLDSEGVVELAARDGISPQAVLLGLIAHCAEEAGERFGILVGSSKVEHVEEDFGTIERFKRGEARSSIGQLKGIDEFKARLGF